MKYKKHSNQKGDMLIEALISMVLMGIFVMGIMFILSKVTVNQRDTKESIVIVNELRNILLTSSYQQLCIDGINNKVKIKGVETTVEVLNCSDSKLNFKVDVTGESVSGAINSINAPVALQAGEYIVGNSQ